MRGYGVGGFIQATTLTREGVRTRILKRWPDVIGQKIDPFAEEASALREAA